MSPPSHFDDDRNSETELEEVEHVSNIGKDVRSMSDTQAFKLMKGVEKDLETKIQYDADRGGSVNDKTWAKFMLAIIKGAMEDKETYKANGIMVTAVRDELAQFKRSAFNTLYVAGVALIFVSWFCIQQLTFLRDLNESKLQQIIDARAEERIRKVIREETAPIIKRELNSPEHIEKLKESRIERRRTELAARNALRAVTIDFPMAKP